MYDPCSGRIRNQGGPRKRQQGGGQKKKRREAQRFAYAREAGRKIRAPSLRGGNITYGNSGEIRNELLARKREPVPRVGKRGGASGKRGAPSRSDGDIIYLKNSGWK